MRALTLAILLLALGRSALADGPFGIEMGRQVQSLTACKAMENSPVTHFCADPPKKHPDFEGYGIVHHPSAGVCSVHGLSLEIKNDPTGTKSRSKMTALITQISETYGPPSKTIDQLVDDTMWDGPTEWMMALSQQKRIYRAEWNFTGGAGRNHVQDIFLVLKAQEFGSVARVLIQFDFENSAQCEAARNKDAAGAF